MGTCVKIPSCFLCRGLPGAPRVAIRTAGKEQDAEFGLSAACPPPWETCPQSSHCPAAPLGGGQARASAAVSLVGTPIFLCAHPVSGPFLKLSVVEKPAFQQPSQQPPWLLNHSSSSLFSHPELLKAGSRQPVQDTSGSLHSASLPTGPKAWQLPACISISQLRQAFPLFCHPLSGSHSDSSGVFMRFGLFCESVLFSLFSFGLGRFFCCPGCPQTI